MFPPLLLPFLHNRHRREARRRPLDGFRRGKFQQPRCPAEFVLVDRPNCYRAERLTPQRTVFPPHPLQRAVDRIELRHIHPRAGGDENCGVGCQFCLLPGPAFALPAGGPDKQKITRPAAAAQRPGGMNFRGAAPGGLARTRAHGVARCARSALTAFAVIDRRANDSTAVVEPRGSTVRICSPAREPLRRALAAVRSSAPRGASSRSLRSLYTRGGFREPPH